MTAHPSIIGPLDRQTAEIVLLHRHQASSGGAWLRYLRQALGLTQQEFGRTFGYSANMVRKMEAGERRPSHAACERIADLLGCGPADRADLQRWLRGVLAY